MTDGRGVPITSPSPGTDIGPCVEVVSAGSEQARRAEQDLDAAGQPIPLSSRPAYLRHLGRSRDVFLLARTRAGQHLAMLAMTSATTRALPGHHMLRIEAVGDSLATPAGFALLEEAARLARTQTRALRLTVELECREDVARAALASALARLGFHQIPCERIPARTILIDLVPSEEAILTGFGKSTRTNIRGAARQDLATVPLDDPSYGPRMNALLAQAFSRTGGAIHSVDWAAVMRLCAELPNRSRLVGAFRGASRAPEDLVGYAWALHHGDRVEYHTGASARVPDIKIRILCPVMWDLITWGKQNGGTWFDLGGVTRGSAGSDDALGGISDFKRGFSKTEIDVGQEWALEPNPLRWRIASLTSRLARRVRRRWRRR